jgi:hypothetical protein
MRRLSDPVRTECAWRPPSNRARSREQLRALRSWGAGTVVIASGTSFRYSRNFVGNSGPRCRSLRVAARLAGPGGARLVRIDPSAGIETAKDAAQRPRRPKEASCPDTHLPARRRSGPIHRPLGRSILGCRAVRLVERTLGLPLDARRRVVADCARRAGESASTCARRLLCCYPPVGGEMATPRRASRCRNAEPW